MSGLDDVYFPVQNENLNNKDNISGWLAEQVPERILRIATAFRHKVSIEEISNITGWDKWFLEQILGIVQVEEHLKTGDYILDEMLLRSIKSMGFSDKRISEITQISIQKIYELRSKFGVFPSYKRVDTCAAEFFQKLRIFTAPMNRIIIMSVKFTHQIKTRLLFLEVALIELDKV